ncbi:MAG: CpsD/CapB family tyrosine-protein kinase [Alphaproteobacteria bacterium]|nr:CpsD/CapB family tyrosine-protein kinase [Alphaproteobacteria bacterium]
MDKLERALEKARQARAAQGGEHGAMPAQAKAFAPEVLPASTTVVDEEVLEKNLIFAHHPKTREADLIRLLRTQILQTMRKNNFKTLAITSPNYGDGKTTLALNLAISIAQDVKQTILLADLDLRKPSAHKYLGLQVDRGLVDYLAGTADVASCLLRLPFERLMFLPAGGRVDHSSEILSSPRMGALAHEMKMRYPDRLIIYDMPPLLAQDDPLAFLPYVDAVMLVVRQGQTQAADIKRCLEILSAAAVVGIVLNDQLSLVPSRRR